MQKQVFSRQEQKKTIEIARTTWHIRLTGEETFESDSD